VPERGLSALACRCSARTQRRRYCSTTFATARSSPLVPSPCAARSACRALSQPSVLPISIFRLADSGTRALFAPTLASASTSGIKTQVRRGVGLAVGPLFAMAWDSDGFPQMLHSAYASAVMWALYYNVFYLRR
jgi:hypothetical protein